MNFCSLSKDSDMPYVLLDKSFVVNYLPECNERQLKVYIMGLTVCSLERENNIQFICDALSMCDKEIEKTFGELADMGLVSITCYNPFAVTYKNIRSTFARHYKTDKYADFNSQLESLFPSVSFNNVNQYTVYYDFIEENKIKPEVLITIARYCVNLKGDKIKANYIIAVAKNWLDEGVRTLADVDEKIKQLETVNESIRLICKAVGKKSEVDIEDKNLYLKLTNNWGFELDAILFAAKSLKNKGGFTKLDSLLDEFYRNNAMSATEIESYLKNKQSMYKLAYSVNKTLGVYYENVEYIVEKYISAWLNKGFDEDSIILIAQYCFNKSIRTLEGMHKCITIFYNEGCVTSQAINEHLAQLMRRDLQIKKIIELTGSSRNVNSNDRDSFKVWTEQWQFDIETVEYAANLCQGKPFSALNNLLAKWKNGGITTAEQAKTAGADSCRASSTQTQVYDAHKLGDYFYSLDELDDIEV